MQNVFSENNYSIITPQYFPNKEIYIFLSVLVSTYAHLNKAVLKGMRELRCNSSHFIYTSLKVALSDGI